MAENTCYEPSRVEIGPAVWPGRGAKNTKKTKGRTENSAKLGIRPAHNLIPICTIFCMLGGTLDVFLKFEFQNDRSRNVGAVGVEVRHCPLTRLIAYTTACCYCTSRDNNKTYGEEAEKTVALSQLLVRDRNVLTSRRPVILLNKVLNVWPCVCSGLTLIANIQQHQYVAEVGATAGLIVLVQPQNLMPFPEDRGKLVNPGYQTEIAFTQVF